MDNIIRFQSKAERFKDDIFKRGTMNPHQKDHVPMWSGKVFSIEVNRSVSEKLLQLAKAIQECDITIVEEE